MPDLQEQFGQIDIYLFDQLLRGRIRPGMRVLDTGCGSGRNLVYFLREGYEVFGVDTDPNAIECTRGLAASLAPALPADNFRVEAIEEMTFPDAFADLVLTSAVLHFARRDDHFEAMLRATWRVLKPGGLFFCRLASSIGMEHQVQRVAGRRFRLPDGSERYLVDEALLLRLTAELGGQLADPLKTTIVQNQRCMTTWVVRKNAWPRRHSISQRLSLPFRQRQQRPSPCALGGRPALGLQPPAEILHLHPMLDRGLLDAHLQLRQALSDLLHPHVPAQDSQRLRHRLVQRLRGHLHRVLGAGEVAAGDLAGAEGHAEKGSMARLLFAMGSLAHSRPAQNHYLPGQATAQTGQHFIARRREIPPVSASRNSKREAAQGWSAHCPSVFRHSAFSPYFVLSRLPTMGTDFSQPSKCRNNLRCLV